MSSLDCRARRSPGKSLYAVVAASMLIVATVSHAQNKCSATGVMAGEKFSAGNCVVAFYPDQNSVTIWFNEAAITPQEQDAFQLSAYADSAKGGKDRTMLLALFCPGGGQPAASAGAIKSIDLGMTHAKSAMAGAQWVIEAPRDFKVERIAGDLKPGGNLSGRITGARTSDGRPYSWDLMFDVTLPLKDAASGMTCRK
ncbi:MAG TPA: hypothetical protein PLW68_05405 [Casimicrobiaceae bacterium]|nr:hypothetical protein [Casimicrobiaceae bacterium]